ncbi:Stk1 family PASTA domain-containing Ser/Thr kinase [Corynebacterium epidermidicanis]|uniref:non-specific serine/threonine protein kinase n=1 Tax=Corynebacterium epidermidicanis TaxID=1050174 RepID=A0A0G3GVG2_9CORY|nr:Stk1 family PASTA domain-containing Ser/Thr kinase [Corynebacterium epidermidicanis]AKK03538.1 serine/threonine protein kinase [Corynebacterium epidermidicanis]
MSSVQVGDILDNRYRIDTPIARGGMSTVYRCVDLRLGRQVAAKVMDDRYLDDPIFRTRFEREARSMAQLNHPNLVNVYDFSSSSSHAFLIMELITGGTLRELLAERGPMPPHAATQVLREILTGLAAAHRLGIVHRDIKPDNVLISSSHQVKLADFGLVRAITESERTSDHIIGTVSYLSPEQVDGGHISAATDVYSAGIVLFELLTGMLPFSGDTQLGHAMARLSRDVPPPSSRIDGVPPLFDELVAAATHRDPADRFATAMDFLAALEDVAAAEHLPAFTVPVPRNSAAARATAIVSLPPLNDAARTDLIDTTDSTKVIPSHPVQPSGPPARGVADQTAQFPAAPSPSTAEESFQQLHTRVESAISPEPGTPAVSRSFAPEPPPKPISNRSSIKIIVWLIVVGMLLASVAVGGWWFGSGRYGEIPQVLGLDEHAATATVEQAGFVSSIRPTYSDDMPAGSVIGTDPPFGQRAPRSQQVVVLLSQGRPTVPVLPTNGDVQRFRELLQERGLHLSFGEATFSDDVPVGGVVSTSPPVGSFVTVGATVTASLSKGPAPVEVPVVAGLTEQQARQLLEKAGLRVSGVDRVFQERSAAGTVIDSTPANHTKVARGTDVELKVSNALTVPDVSGLDRTAAKRVLEEAGFVVAIQESSEAREKKNLVVKQAPEPGALVNPDHAQATIHLNSKVKVANVLGKSIPDATRILEEQGLAVSVLRDGDRVIRQTPRSKSEVSADQVIELSAL